jgi:hypothetical protein
VWKPSSHRDRTPGRTPKSPWQTLSPLWGPLPHRGPHPCRRTGSGNFTLGDCVGVDNSPNRDEFNRAWGFIPVHGERPAARAGFLAARLVSAKIRWLLANGGEIDAASHFGRLERRRRRCAMMSAVSPPRTLLLQRRQASDRRRTSALSRVEPADRGGRLAGREAQAPATSCSPPTRWCRRSIQDADGPRPINSSSIRRSSITPARRVYRFAGIGNPGTYIAERRPRFW